MERTRSEGLPVNSGWHDCLKASFRPFGGLFKSISYNPTSRQIQLDKLELLLFDHVHPDWQRCVSVPV